MGNDLVHDKQKKHQQTVGKKRRGQIIQQLQVQGLQKTANLLFAGHQYSEAIALYTNAITHVTSFQDSLNDDGIQLLQALYLNRARSHVKLKNHDAALKDVRACLAVDANSVFAYKALYCMAAIHLEALQETAAAIPHSNKIMNTPNDGNARNQNADQDEKKEEMDTEQKVDFLQDVKPNEEMIMTAISQLHAYLDRLNNVERQNIELKLELDSLQHFAPGQNLRRLTPQKLDEMEVALHQKLRDVREAKLEQNLCVVCLDQQKDHVLVPCGHLCICGECKQAYQVDAGAICPMCRQKVEKIMKVFH